MKQYISIDGQNAAPVVRCFISVVFAVEGTSCHCGDPNFENHPGRRVHGRCDW